MVLAVVDDLLFGSKLRAAARAAGRRIVFVRERGAVLQAIREHAPEVVVFDLDRDQLDPVGLIAEIRSSGGMARLRLVGFASHVHGERMQGARDAGCDRVMARSAFVSALPGVLQPDSPAT